MSERMEHPMAGLQFCHGMLITASQPLGKDVNLFTLSFSILAVVRKVAANHFQVLAPV